MTKHTKGRQNAKKRLAVRSRMQRELFAIPRTKCLHTDNIIVRDLLPGRAKQQVVTLLRLASMSCCNHMRIQNKDSV